MKLVSSLLVVVALALSGSALDAQRVGASRYNGGHRPSYSSSRVWVSGRYETREERVWVPGPIRREWVPALHEWRLTSCGLRYVCVREGYWREVQLPGHYETRCVRVYVPGHWVARR